MAFFLMNLLVLVTHYDMRHAYLEDFLVELCGQLGSADFAQNAESEAHQVVIAVSEVNSDAVGGHHEQLGLLVEELRQSQIADSLLDERVASDEVETLHLAEVGLLARHVNEKQLRDVAGSHVLFIFLHYYIGTAKDYLMTAISF